MRSLFAALSLVLLASCVVDEESVSDDFKEVKPLGPVPEGEPAKHPIILAHGFNAAPGALGGFDRVADVLRNDGHVVYEAIVPPFAAVEARADALADVVDLALENGAEKVNIIAHSMGGLDSRYLVTELGYAPFVSSVTTISTPHWGSAVADRTLEILDGLAIDDELLNDVATWLGLKFNELAEDSDLRATFIALSETQMQVFNETVVDQPEVHYQSWAGVSSVSAIKNPLDFDACEDEILGDGKRADHMSPLLVPLAGIVAKGELIPNDGLVAVESAKWGDFRGCIPADHIDEVGVPSRKGADKHTGFDHLRFYRNVAFELSTMGF